MGTPSPDVEVPMAGSDPLQVNVPLSLQNLQTVANGAPGGEVML